MGCTENYVKSVNWKISKIFFIIDICGGYIQHEKTLKLLCLRISKLKYLDN